MELEGLICVGQTILFAVEKFSFDGGSAEFYHVCTDGASIDWMFMDDFDYVAGVNRVGMCSVLSDVRVVSFVLMDNHVHFVLHGTMPKCKDFIIRYKKLTGKLISSRYRIKGRMRALPTEIIRIDSHERLLATIAYLDRNPMVAGWRKMPDEYLWGVGRFLFRDMLSDPTCRRLDSFSRREQNNLLGTHQLMPQNWLVDGKGMIDPRCFVDVDFLEKLFRTPGRYLYFLSKKLEGEIDSFISTGSRTFLQDRDLRGIVMKLSQEHFGEGDVNLLSVNSRLLLARKLRYDYASTVKQISRMLHLDVELLKGFV